MVPVHLYHVAEEGTQAPAQRLHHSLASNNSDLTADLASFAFHSCLHTAGGAASFSRAVKFAYYDTVRLKEHSATTRTEQTHKRRQKVDR